MSNLNIRIATEGKDLVIHMEGILSFHHHREGDDLIETISNALDTQKPQAVRFNLSKVESLDSHWLSVLIRVLRRSKEKNIDMTVDHPSPEVKRLFEIVQMDRVISIR